VWFFMLQSGQAAEVLGCGKLLEKQQHASHPQETDSPKTPFNKTEAHFSESF
jgi:hypothetical protein